VHARRLAAGAAVFGLFVVLGSPVAVAQTYGSDNDGIFSKLMKSVGLRPSPATEGHSDYTERPPLVVPPTRDLPPPQADPVKPAADWPTGAPKPVKHARGKAEIVPSTAVQTPNPSYQKKPWYDPRGWFSHEEYATFAGEPVRQDLTDPPAGYRVPSPDQPYGISPETKGKPTARDFGLNGSSGQQPAQSGQPPAQ
jgi:hypothetical protein